MQVPFLVFGNPGGGPPKLQDPESPKAFLAWNTQASLDTVARLPSDNFVVMNNL
jgi:hypothetical protein